MEGLENNMILPVIMAGGTGSRLWPLSRELNPKQFLPLVNDQSMLQNTLTRLEGIEHQAPCLICNEEHRFLAAEQLRQMGLEDCPIMLEPEGRNTAPAIALAALNATANGEDPLLLVLAADHEIKDVAAFQQAVNQAIPLAEAGKLVTFGIVPDRAETGYGYIERGVSGDNGSFSVARFVEKPDADTAAEYLTSGNYFWNSGMFLFRASMYLSELRDHDPEMVTHCERALSDTEQDMSFVRVDRAAFARCRSEAVDTAVMEKTQNAVVMPLDAGWSDIGSWSALWDIQQKDGDRNAIRGDVLSESSFGNFIQADHRLVAAVGVNDLVIVETKDAVLVAHKDQVQQVKAIVGQIKQQGRHEHFNHREVYRPWGFYDSILSDDRYQVKKISIKPGEKLSLQMHHHRSEHWIVVKGTARVTRGEESFLLTENESTYIPIGTRHCLENPGQVAVELIEVQSGSYLGEDDIVRFEDRYGRADQ